MKDEEYVFLTDSFEKKNIARNARNRRTHNGKGGRVRLPCDNLTGKELNKMNGECKSYRLNNPMSWEEFLAMPHDIQRMYVGALRGKYNVPNVELAKMFGKERTAVSNYLNRHGFGQLKCGKSKWDKEGFYAWWGGVPLNEQQEEPCEEEDVEEVAETEYSVPAAEPVEETTAEPIVEVENFSPSYERTEDEIGGLKREVSMLLRERENLYREREKLKAQLDIVYLIFSGKPRGYEHG